MHIITMTKMMMIFCCNYCGNYETAMSRRQQPGLRVVDDVSKSYTLLSTAEWKHVPVVLIFETKEAGRAYVHKFQASEHKSSFYSHHA